MLISIVVPTRGRPERLQQMWRSALETATGPVELVTYLDIDDLRAMEYPTWARTVMGPRCVLSEAWNRAAEKAHGDILLMAGDDLIFRTFHWDAKVKLAAEQFGDGIALIHTRDGFQDEAIATHPFVTRRWYETVGMLCPPYFTADYNDVWLHEVADAIGRRVWRPDILIEHIHPDAGKAPMDETYIEQRQRRWNDSMPAVYDQLGHIRGEWADKLRGAMWVQPPTSLSTE